MRELIRLRDLLGLSLDELVALAEAEEARAALRDQWYGDPTDEERLAIVERASELVRQQLELVRSRQRTLGDFADELEAKLETLAGRRAGLLADPGR
jgi:DNA-binding transcriptional MerR regulator